MRITKNSELVLTAEFKKTIAKIVNDSLDKNAIDGAWLTNADRLCRKILTCDPGDFLQWDVILRTMVVGNANFVRDELDFLQALPDWESRWKDAIEESSVGNPTYYDEFPSSSGNLIHLAYHLAQFEKKTGIDINRAGFILEFGGGYGGMCRLIHKLNFKGRYIIFDLPPLSALQHFFINMNGIPVGYYNKFLEKDSNGVICVSDFAHLGAVVSDYPNIDNAVFLATWSLSETPISLRQSILSLVEPFKAFLLAYQGYFGNIDNSGFFLEWADAMNDIEWHSWKIKHLPNKLYRDNYYLMGKRIC
ncbi:MAG: hypothetical protein WCY09_00220 [Candidatus Omnitrophota bacterium]